MKSGKAEKTETVFGLIVMVLVAGMLAAFVVNSLIYTGYNALSNEEVVLFKKDNIVYNFIGIILICNIYYILYYFINKISNKIDIRVITGAFMLVSLFCGIYWIRHIYAKPMADSFSICDAAVKIRRGDYSDFAKGGYMVVCANQLGMLTLVRAMFKVFGLNNWISIEYLNAFMVPFIIMSGSEITYEITRSKRAGILSLIMLFLFSPLYFYTSFVYNDELALGFMMLTILCVLKFIKKPAILYGFFSSVFMAAAVLLRTNAIICFIGIFIIVFIVGVVRKKWCYMCLLAGMAATIAITTKVNTGIYEKYKSTDTTGTLGPMHIAMGMRESDLGLGAGWYGLYMVYVHLEADWDTELENEIAINDIKESMSYFINNPKYMLDFYSRKINSQWNVPLYQSIAMNNSFEKIPDGIVWKIYNDTLIRKFLDNYANFFHALVMGMALLYVIVLGVKRESLDKYLIFTIIYGGFLFSILWEAKSRYVFPYFIMLIPYAAAGLNRVFAKIEKVLLEFRRRKMISN